MRPKSSGTNQAFRVRLAILLLEIALPFGLYYALQSDYNWLAMVCLAGIVLGIIGVILIQ